LFACGQKSIPDLDGYATRGWPLSDRKRHHSGNLRTTAMLIVSLAAALAALLAMTVIVLGTPPTVPH
jgi:hypothetical protein